MITLTSNTRNLDDFVIVKI